MRKDEQRAEQRAEEREPPHQPPQLEDLAEPPAPAERDDAVRGGGPYVLTGVSHAATLTSEKRGS